MDSAIHALLSYIFYDDTVIKVSERFKLFIIVGITANDGSPTECRFPFEEWCALLVLWR